jgi:membrane glycosyltransferase
MDGQLAVRVMPSAADAAAGQRGAMPPPAPLAMPVQDLSSRPDTSFMEELDFRAVLARALTLSGTIAIVAYGVTEMIGIMRNDDMTSLQVALIVFFGLTLAWIAQAAAASVAGLLPQRRPPLAPPSEVAKRRTALVMPIYNEDPLRTTTALQAMAEELAAAGHAGGFEIFVLSDSTRPDAWIRESIAIARLRERLAGVMPVWYRRRWRNIGRKSGNVQEFVERWGARYDFMVVLDADSLLSADTLMTLARAMCADPQLGLLQTVPLLVGRRSVLARLQQFAGRMYGPVIARGLAAWSGNDGNYWGHNAIIRVAAFAQSCGLPELPGRKPFGGHILSHDFVEAALMRRRGWKVRMLPKVLGSYEESPPSLIDLAVRDRRWAQGNLQHAKVLGTSGLTMPSRMHLAFGIMSYVASPLWLVMLVLSFALSVQAGLHNPEYFPLEIQLFPNWPRFDAERMLDLFIFCMGVLLLPKAIGFLRAFFSLHMHRTLGTIEMVASTVVELVLSALYAPVMMLMQSRSVAEILLGRDSGWSSQRRDEGAASWGEAWRMHWGHTLAGVLLTALFAWLAPPLLPWLSPVLAGMLLAVPLSRLSGSTAVGNALGRHGLLCIPEEEETPAIVARRDALLAQAEPLPEDGLAALACDPALVAAHLGVNPPPPLEPRGQPVAARLTAQKKLEDATSLQEALAWLTTEERLQVAAHAAMLHRLAALAGRTA